MMSIRYRCQVPPLNHFRHQCTLMTVPYKRFIYSIALSVRIGTVAPFYQMTLEFTCVVCVHCYFPTTILLVQLFPTADYAEK